MLRSRPRPLNQGSYRLRGLARERRRAGLSVAELGRLSGYPERGLRALEDGRSAQTITINRLAGYLGTTKDKLIARGE